MSLSHVLRKPDYLRDSIQLVVEKIQEWKGGGSSTIRERDLPANRPAVLRGLLRDWLVVQAGRRSLTSVVDYFNQNFERHVSLLPEVMECYSVSGDRDYLLQVVARDMDSYNDFLNAEILRHEAVRSASSTFVLKRVKYSTALPL